MMRRFTIAVLMAVTSLAGGAQNYITPMTADLTPPTPQSAQIMEYQMPQPAMLTGAVDLSVPIFTIPCGDYSLPIYMQYHSNGIKVMDDPAPCGYGWALMPALRATRTILGRPDERYKFTNNFSPDQDIVAHQCMVNAAAYTLNYNDKLDSQHDIISIALPDYTLTRIIDFSKGIPEFRGACDSEYHVSSDSNLDVITVTDPRGIKYYFGSPYETQSGVDITDCRTCWALNKITTPGGETIKINWHLAAHTYANRRYLGGYSFLDSFDLTLWWNSGINIDEFDSNSAEEAAFQLSGGTFSFLTISSIEFPGGKVTFAYENTAHPEMLTRITFSNGSDNIVTAVFCYDGLARRLEKITLSNEGDYRFGYMPGSNVNPPIHAQDWWGFFNNKNNSSLTPKLEIKRYHSRQNSDGVYRECGEADRSVDTLAMMNNMLTSITYPTGGRCDFEYEPHKFNRMRDESAKDQLSENTNPYLSYGGGVRVKRITARSGSDMPERVVNYEYGTARVRAVPSAATFVDVCEAAIGLAGVDDSGWGIDYVRSVNIRPFSNYMRYDIGETPIWYETVRARYAEGCEVYRHEDLIKNGNMIAREYGYRAHQGLHKVFSKGPQLVAKETYALKNGRETLVERDSMHYTTVYGAYTSCSFVGRSLIHVRTSSMAAPDFDNINEVAETTPPNMKVSGRPIYEVIGYSVVEQKERLTAKIHTEYTENGNITTTETYKYKAGTSLLESVSTTTSEGALRTTTLQYPDVAHGGISAQMAAAHVSGVPVRELTTCGEASVEYRADYVQASSGAFVPRQVTTTLGTGATLSSPVMTYNAGGRPVQSTDADGRSTAWLWGYGNLHPVLKVEGMTYAQLCARDSRVAGNNDRAENLALTITDRPVWRYTFRPLAFLTGVVAPWGTHTRYGYGWRNQLSEVERNGKLTEYHDFTLKEGFVKRNRLEDGVLYDDERIYVKTTDFDGFGRITRSSDNLSDAVVTTRYDAMGRAFCTSVPLSAGTVPGATDWSVTGFEASPRGVVEWAMRPGNEWAGAGRRSTVKHLTNTPEGEYQCFRFNATASGLRMLGVYAPGRLRVTESTDEDGHTVREYRTLDGRVVQTSEGRPGDWLHTRYAYDAYGRLCVVLPPVIGAYNGPYSDAAMQNKAYIYTYDEYGRCTSAKVPGCEPSLTRYSRAGRVIAEHTPGMDEGKWLMHHYDACGREVLSSIASATEEQLRTVAAALPVAAYDAAATGAYTLSPPLPMDPGAPQKAVFYDNYDFLGKTTALPAISRTVRPLGLPAGSRDYVASSSGLTSALSYDADGFVAEEAAQTPFGTLHKSYIRDRQGAVLTETEEFTPQSGSKIRRVTACTYDAGGRLTRRRITENGVTAETACTYDSRGNLDSETFGNGVKRRYSYDIHNWPVKTETDVPLKLTIGPWEPKPITPQYYAALRPDSGKIIIPIKPGLTVDTYTERLLYADGATPRYTGCPSARVNILGGRYDYRYDTHDRLTHADYTPADGADEDEDFSAVYTYDAMARPTRVSRSGIIDVDADGTESFGLLDVLTYSYDSAGRVKEIDSDPDGADYYGRPGFPTSGSEYSWDAAGRMTADTGRDINLIKYDHRNLPKDIAFGDGRRINNFYDADGALIRTVLIPRGIVGTGYHPTVRTYAADRVWEDSKLLYSYFPGGYFDARGAVHYLHNDYQGSVVLVTDSTGTVEQRNTYYPYGEPHRTPAGQPILYGGKEHDPVTGEYDYGARQHFAPGLLWSVPDALAEKFYPISPYVFCNGNPIFLQDPSGLNPVYSITGKFLGATESGLTGDYYILNENDYNINLTDDKLKELAIDPNTLDEETIGKIKSHYKTLPDRPDYDGYLTLSEANEWYRNGNGEPLYVDLSKIDLSPVRSLGNENIGKTKPVNLLDITGKTSKDGLVYGSITIIQMPDDYVRAKHDVYDFDMHKGKGFKTKIRNCLTKIGAWYAGKGTAYNIYFYNKAKVKKK